ncbi:MAG: DNA repair protein RecN [Chloroflexi bacterium]|nr:DNA repair protein RecN [Chloroflexota bacterium]MDA1174439.1 DNA repair protein RecN [Chloroflexota bacterium]
MLIELTVRNLAVIEHTQLELGHALNVVTGETGAGKSLLVDALEFVLGGVADRSLIRAGADAASVEAIFQVREPSPSLAAALTAAGVDLDDEGAIVLFRETHREGRTVSRLNGRAVPVSVVRGIGVALVDIHGQGTHLSLLDPTFQLVMLDSHATDRSLRPAVEQAVAVVRTLEAELAELSADSRAAAQQKDLLDFQVNEIADAGIVPGEEAVLVAERDELANARMIQEACATAYEALYGDSANADDLIAQAVQALRRSMDPSGKLAGHVNALEESAARLSDAARDIRSYAEGISGDPARLLDVEERIEVLRRLKRKYGDTEEAVLAFADEAQQKLEAYETSDERLIALTSQIANAREWAGTQAWELSKARRDAGQRLSVASAEHLIEVGMPQVRFACEITQRQDDDGLTCPDGVSYAFDATGIDHVEFLVETNPGEGLKPLARVASGGETARLMLALISALRSEAGVPTLVFDEIDSGIGARASEIVGRKLWALGGAAQVLCVTHLPQIAAYADRHFRVQKAVEDERTFAGALALDATARVNELAEMLGGERNDDIDGAARRMLEAAEATKAAS